jgi:hypothetical protein
MVPVLLIRQKPGPFPTRKKSAGQRQKPLPLPIGKKIAE